MTTTDPKYIFRITRFQCGCVYRAGHDEAVFCPEHRQSSPVGFVTGHEAIPMQTPGVPGIPGLVMNPHALSLPMELRNDERNSLHVESRTLDGRQNEWGMNRADEVGLCAACLIDEECAQETRVARCECGDEGCSYRWCGDTRGLHALWRLHAQGVSQESIGIPEEDIFEYGGYDEQNQETRELLDREGNHLRDRAGELLRAVLETRRAAPGEPQEPVYWIGIPDLTAEG